MARFTPEIAAVARLTVVADPDNLLIEPGVVEALQRLGFEIIAFDDHVVFRYAYERRFRRIWDAGTKTNLVVVLRAARAEVDALPYDLLEEARRESRLLVFGLADIFPRLDPHAVGELDRGDLDALFAAHDRHASERLGENSTRDFLLRHVFQVAPELIKSSSDLLRVLLRRHARGRVVPASLDDRLVRMLRDAGAWSAWPLEQIVPNRAAFFDFLQERWPRFVREEVSRGANQVAEAKANYGLRYAGPEDLPFDHDDVRAYVGELFAAGHLRPTTAIPKAAVHGTWMSDGVGGDEESDSRERMYRLLGLLSADLAADHSDHRSWIRTAQTWAEIVALRWAPGTSLDSATNSRVEMLHRQMEGTFGGWLKGRYGLLHSLAAWPQPAMVHHIPRFLAHGMAASGPSPRRAVIVVDGLALDQWVVLRHEIPAREWSVLDTAIFAWVPTLTTVSRQAIFAGAPPYFFSASIDTTQKEEKHWGRFWEEHGLRRGESAYFCQGALETDEGLIERATVAVAHPRTRVVAVVVGTVDQMLHGSVMGTDGLHASVRHWARRGTLQRLLSLLADHGFEICLTADHGNVEGVGFGRPNVGVTAEERGERVHVFRDETTRRGVHARFPTTVEWSPVGLPEDYLPLIAPPQHAFVHEGGRIVAHGGTCIEEVVVPFVQISRKP